MRQIIFSIAAALLMTSAAQGQTVVSEGPATTILARQYVLTSAKAGRNFLVQVSNPVLPAPAGQKAAVIYVLDGNAAFGTVTDTLRLLQIDGAVRPTYVVAIGYPTESYVVINGLRFRDYTHVRTQGASPQGGGGAAFEAFVMEELRPFIEARLPIDPSQSYLAGHSLGGLFSATILTSRPDAFAGYLIASPSLQLDMAMIEKAGTLKGQAKVYVVAGEAESATIPMAANAQAFATALSRPGSGFMVRSQVLPGATHGSVPSAGLAAGLRFLLGSSPSR